MIAALLAAALPAAAGAADPEFNPDSGPVKIVVGFQPGGIGDTVARLFSDAVRSGSTSAWSSRTAAAPTA